LCDTLAVVIFNRVWMLFFFFFSSRRRHTRSDRDWSSDVCSSDLVAILRETAGPSVDLACAHARSTEGPAVSRRIATLSSATGPRSEERRVGKECRSRGSGYQ